MLIMGVKRHVRFLVLFKKTWVTGMFVCAETLLEREYAQDKMPYQALYTCLLTISSLEHNCSVLYGSILRSSDFGSDYSEEFSNYLADFKYIETFVDKSLRTKMQAELFHH
jgi:hypothetical protein